MAKGSKREGGGIGELLAYAGDRKFLTYLGMALSALSQLLSFGPYVCIWLVARDLIAVAPNWSEACDIAMYGWWAGRFCPGEHRDLFRGAHVHTPIRVSLRVQYPQGYERASA